MSEAEATDCDVLEDVFAVDEEDDVHLAVRNYEWANPYEVTDVDHVEWVGATGGSWATRRVTVEGGYGSVYTVTAIEGDDELVLRYDDGDVRGTLERFEPTSDSSTEDDGLSEAPDVDLEEADADDAPEDTGDDVQEDLNEDDGDQITVDSVSDPGDDVGVELPEGVTPEDVDDLTSGGVELGELAHELAVHPNRARSIAHGLGFYARVREVINLPGVDR